MNFMVHNEIICNKKLNFFFKSNTLKSKRLTPIEHYDVVWFSHNIHSPIGQKMFLNKILRENRKKMEEDLH